MAGIPDNVAGEDIIHAYPVNDLQDHDTDSRGKCWCKPEIQEEATGYVVVHNSMDGREDFEQGKRSYS